MLEGLGRTDLPTDGALDEAAALADASQEAALGASSEDAGATEGRAAAVETRGATPLSGARMAMLQSLDPGQVGERLTEGVIEKLPPDDPTLRPGHTWEYRHVEGPVFLDGAHYTDVDQGSLADCWLMGGLAAIAHTKPEYLTRAIRENANGTYSVRLFERTVDAQGKVRFRAHTEIVKPTFPGNEEGRFHYADPTPNNKPELWVALIEKAYAQWKGGDYEALSGGQAANAMMALTGKPAGRTTITPTMDEDALYTRLRAASQGSHPIALGTRDDTVGDGLVAWHTYTVLDVFERDGERFVKLYNPSGANDRDIDQTSVIPFAEVTASFKSLYISEA